MVSWLDEVGILRCSFLWSGLFSEINRRNNNNNNTDNTNTNNVWDLLDNPNANSWLCYYYEIIISRYGECLGEGGLGVVYRAHAAASAIIVIVFCIIITIIISYMYYRLFIYLC